jgi:hypothetical protein
MFQIITENVQTHDPCLWKMLHIISLRIVRDNLKHLPEAMVMCLHIVRDNLKHLPEARVLCLHYVRDNLKKMFQIITDNV